MAEVENFKVATFTYNWQGANCHDGHSGDQAHSRWIGNAKK